MTNKEKYGLERIEFTVLRFESPITSSDLCKDGIESYEGVLQIDYVPKHAKDTIRLRSIPVEKLNINLIDKYKNEWLNETYLSMEELYA